MIIFLQLVLSLSADFSAGFQASLADRFSIGVLVEDQQKLLCVAFHFIIQNKLTIFFWTTPIYLRCHIFGVNHCKQAISRKQQPVEHITEEQQAAKFSITGLLATNLKLSLEHTFTTQKSVFFFFFLHNINGRGQNTAAPSYIELIFSNTFLALRW